MTLLLLALLSSVANQGFLDPEPEFSFERADTVVVATILDEPAVEATNARPPTLSIRPESPQ